MWRAEDEALLARLEDEAALERLWAHAAPGAEPLPPRASGLIRMLREREPVRSPPDPAGTRAAPRAEPAALRAAHRAEPAELLALATPARLAGLPPELVHHLALFHRGRAEHLIERAESTPAARDAIERSLALAISGWLALGRERAYLDSLVRAVIAGALPDGELERELLAVPLRGLGSVAAIARAGARDRAPSRGRALAALGRIEQALDQAGIAGDDPLAARARARAHDLRTAIVHDALEPIAIELDELAAREWTADEVVAAMERAVDAWRWCGEDAELEHAIVTELPRFAWDLYRDRRWEPLRAVLRPLEPAIDRLARRVEADPAQLPWAAQCAQAIVFRAELAPTLEAQIALAERSLRLCPTLRNARLVLADLLCARAERRLDQPLLLRGADARAEAAKDVARAEDLFPELKRLPAIRQRLGAGRKGGA